MRAQQPICSASSNGDNGETENSYPDTNNQNLKLRPAHACTWESQNGYYKTNCAIYPEDQKCRPGSKLQK